jgi:glycosyltransferase involved in cell wall biosynthesis
MEQASISCIIPVYNGERYLREAIDSVLAQTCQALEIIVVDDGSTDGTGDIVASYGDRLRYVRHENAGPAAARNRGLSLVQAEYVAFQDADDLWHPEKLARQMARFLARPELDLCFTHLQNFWMPEMKGEVEHFRNHRFAGALPGYCAPSLLARRVLFDTVGRFNSGLRLSEDTDWILRAGERGVVMELLPDVLVYRRWHTTNMSRSSRELLVDAVKASLDRRRETDGGLPRPLQFSDPSVS